MRIVAVVMFLLMTTAAAAATLESKDAARKLTDDVVGKITFTFYKPDSKWVLNSFTFDDNINALFE